MVFEIYCASEENLMWFKTRVGFSSIEEPMEIHVAKYPKADIPIYSVFARSINDVHVDYKGLFGTFKASARATHLAQFNLTEASRVEVARCMKLIEDAIATQAKICDLSAVGDEGAWKDDWELIEW